MRTTLNIDAHLLAEAKQVAARTHRSVGAVVDDALRSFFVEPQREPGGADDFRLPTDGEGGLRPGVDLDDKEMMAELLGENEPRADT